MADGREQVTAFQMPGDIIGTDGIATGAYASNVFALEYDPVTGSDFNCLPEFYDGDPDRIWTLRGRHS